MNKSQNARPRAAGPRQEKRTPANVIRRHSRNIAIAKVREMLKRLEEDGWRVVRVRGSHRVLKHPVKTGIVVVAGQEKKDLAIGTLKSIWRQAELEGQP